MNPKSIYTMSGVMLGLAFLAWIKPIRWDELLLAGGLTFGFGVLLEARR